MTRSLARLFGPLALLPVVALGLGAQTRPPSWRAAIEPASAGDTALVFVTMPPGWHITSSAPVTLFDAAHARDGDFVVRSELFVFPAASTTGGGGIFVGGRGLESDAPAFTALLVRGDGRFRIVRRDRGGTRDLVPWTVHPAVAVVGDSAAPARNVLAVSARGDSVRFEVNGVLVSTLPGADVAPDGIVGFRLDRDVNVHVATLELDGRNVAPPRPRRS